MVAAFDSALEQEWLETDGRGGFAMGTSLGLRTRRYHALLVAAARSPLGRVTLVNGFEAALHTPSGRYALSAQEYEPEVIHPDGWTRIQDFRAHPWPRWRFRIEDGSLVEQELLMARTTGETLVRFRLIAGSPKTRLELRPLLSGRDFHSLHRETDSYGFEPERRGQRLVFTPYSDVPRITLRSNGRYAHGPMFFRNFRYREELARGLDYLEDLASPGALEFDLTSEPALLAFGWLATDQPASALDERPSLEEVFSKEAERRARKTLLDLSAEQYLVRCGERHSVIAGYPWFSDWGRDTFIALRGLCLASGRVEQARSILDDWSRVVQNGLLPNFFPDGAAEPEYNSIDASLWYVMCVHELLARGGDAIARDEVLLSRLSAAVSAILDGLARATRYGIRVDHDGLLAAGQPGVQLTWMDAKVGDFVVTPRIGKPVEIQALWLNALRIGSELGCENGREFAERYELGLSSFRKRFPCAATGGLYDVVDVDHEPGRDDASIRPNQIFAVGGLPHGLLGGEQAAAVVAKVEAELYTPCGLRTLSARERGYRGRLQGGVFDRDTAYHMGTVWPWLLGPFVEAWLRVRGQTAHAKREASERFVRPWLAEIEHTGLGHISEIADADHPHIRRGAPFQAWSLGELMRIRALLGDLG